MFFFKLRKNNNKIRASHGNAGTKIAREMAMAMAPQKFENSTA